MVNIQENKYKVFWDEENRMGRVIVIGEVDIELTKKMVEEGKGIQEEHYSRNKKMGWLIDVTKVTKPALSLRTREVMSDAIKIMKTGKIAIVGNSIVIKTVMVFIMAAAGQKQFQYFTSEEDALKWLKKDS